MATEATPQVLDTSVDALGLSIVTSTRTASNPRFGAIYNPSTLAAAIPVWFHPLPDGRYVALFAETWSSATQSTTGGPQSYSAKNVSTNPHWAVVDPITGAAGPVTAIPANQFAARTLVAACSQNDYLFLIHNDGLLQHHRVQANGAVVLEAEEFVPTRDGVTLTTGCYTDGNWLVLIGSDPMKRVYRARKNWARVGIMNEDWQWNTDKGWLVDTTPVALEGEIGALLAERAVTYAKRADREYLALGRDNGQANVYSSRMVDPKWRFEYAIPGTHVAVQSQLRVNQDAIPGAAHNGFPVVKTALDSSVGKNSLQVSWSVLPV